VFAELVLSLDRFDPQAGSGSGWLFGIARNVLARPRARLVCGLVRDRPVSVHVRIETPQACAERFEDETAVEVVPAARTQPVGMADRRMLSRPASFGSLDG
jgi:hypothetical protein